jgi:hypothetical protein
MFLGTCLARHNPFASTTARCEDHAPHCGQTSLPKTFSASSACWPFPLLYGIYRAKLGGDHERGRVLVEELSQAIPVHPVTLGIGELAGGIDGERTATGHWFSFEHTK